MSIVEERVAPQQEDLPEPVWDIAWLFPPRGDWSDEEYLALPGGRLVELSERTVEVLPMPTVLHQSILFFLARMLARFVEQRGLGKVLPAGISVRLWPGKYRQPDIVFMGTQRLHGQNGKYWDGADLVMEMVSDDAKDRERDLVTKRQEYAQAGILEYWIVDPLEERILVLALDGDHYRVHGEFRPGAQATSALLPGFSVSVDDVLAGGEPPAE